MSINRIILLKKVARKTRGPKSPLQAAGMFLLNGSATHLTYTFIAFIARCRLCHLRVWWNMLFTSHYKDPGINHAGFHANNLTGSTAETKASNTQNAWSKVAIKGKILPLSDDRLQLQSHRPHHYTTMLWTPTWHTQSEGIPKVCQTVQSDKPNTNIYSNEMCPTPVSIHWIHPLYPQACCFQNWRPFFSFLFCGWSRTARESTLKKHQQKLDSHHLGPLWHPFLVLSCMWIRLSSLCASCCNGLEPLDQDHNLRLQCWCNWG